MKKNRAIRKNKATKVKANLDSGRPPWYSGPTREVRWSGRKAHLMPVAAGYETGCPFLLDEVPWDPHWMEMARESPRPRLTPRPAPVTRKGRDIPLCEEYPTLWGFLGD